MAGRRVHFVMSEELLARIDAELVAGVSRGEWVRAAVEQALAERDAAYERITGSTPALPPAEQPERTVADVDAVLAPFRGMSGVPPAEQASRHAPNCKCPVCS